MLSEEWQYENYHTTGNNYHAWRLCAGNLLAASRILKKHRDKFDADSLQVGDVVPDKGRILTPELLLRGFAVECLLKALWIKRGGILFEDGKYVGVPYAGDHDLYQLANANGLSFSECQRDVLKRLSIFIVSSGRYPNPSYWSKTKIQKLFRGGKGPLTYWATPSDDKIFDTIVNSLDKQLDN